MSRTNSSDSGVIFKAFLIQASLRIGKAFFQYTVCQKIALSSSPMFTASDCLPIKTTQGEQHNPHSYALYNKRVAVSCYCALVGAILSDATHLTRDFSICISVSQFFLHFHVPSQSGQGAKSHRPWCRDTIKKWCFYF